MQIVFRADASLETGSGHIMRCLTLAEACQRDGAAITFICRAHKGNLIDLIRQRGFVVVALDAPDEGTTAPGTRWLGATETEDAQQTADALSSRSIRPNWLVVDNYGIGRVWEDGLRPQVDKIMVIDDLADREHDCDLLLDQNLLAHMETRYDDKVPGGTLLLGPRYALLHSEYGQLRRLAKPRQSIERVMIYFGGADLNDLTGRALRAVLSIGAWKPEIDVILSPVSPNFKAVKALSQDNGNVILHTSLPSLAPLILKADLAIGAIGATSWERLCLGLPTIGITIADNQVAVADRLHKSGLIFWIGDKDAVSEATIAQSVEAARGFSGLAQLSRNAMEVCDGAGTDRVVAAIKAHAASGHGPAN